LRFDGVDPLLVGAIEEKLSLKKWSQELIKRSGSRPKLFLKFSFISLRMRQVKDLRGPITETDRGRPGDWIHRRSNTLAIQHFSDRIGDIPHHQRF
jgi:hypothetical protein